MAQHATLTGTAADTARTASGVGAGALECLQPADYVVEVGAAVQETLRAGDESKRKRQRTCRLDRGGDAFDRVAEVANWRIHVAARVFDQSADKTGLCRETHGFVDVRGRVAEAAF